MSRPSQASRLSLVCIHRFFQKLPEPRRRRKKVRHPLLNLVVMSLCATIAGADDWQEIAEFARQRRQWFGKFLDLSKGVPSHDTFQRVISALDPLAFQKCLLAWVATLHEVTQGQIIAIDGKVAKEAMARATDKGPLCLVSAWATANQVVLGQVAASSGSNELGALPRLLELLELHGAIVTLDALGCQKEIVSQIAEHGADYVISVKGNQEKLQDTVQQAFAQALEAGLKPSLVKNEKRRGRQEQRMYTVLEAPDFAQKNQWKNLKSFLMVVREYEEKDGSRCQGVRYYISSLPPKVKKLAEAVRRHWHIENKMGWVLDVAFNEDGNRARTRNAQANLGMLRRTALSLLKNAKELTCSIKKRRKQAGWNPEVLEKILLGCNSGKN